MAKIKKAMKGGSKVAGPAGKGKKGPETDQVRTRRIIAPSLLAAAVLLCVPGASSALSWRERPANFAY